MLDKTVAMLAIIYHLVEVDLNVILIYILKYNNVI